MMWYNGPDSKICRRERECYIPFFTISFNIIMDAAAADSRDLGISGGTKLYFYIKTDEYIQIFIYFYLLEEEYIFTEEADWCFPSN